MLSLFRMAGHSLSHLTYRPERGRTFRHPGSANRDGEPPPSGFGGLPEAVVGWSQSARL